MKNIYYIYGIYGIETVNMCYIYDIYMYFWILKNFGQFVKKNLMSPEKFNEKI